MPPRDLPPRIRDIPESGFWVGTPDLDAGWVLLEKHYLIPRRFNAAAWPTKDTRVEISIEVDDQGVPTCRSLKIVPEDENGIVTAAALSGVRLEKLMRLAVSEQMKLRDLREGDVEPKERASSADRDEFYERYRRGARRPRRGSPLTDENLRQVADLYRAAVRRGDPPTQMVADQMHVARSTAGRWVAAARQRALLGPAERGKGGEAA